MRIDKVELLFLDALKASLSNTFVGWTEELTADEWKELFSLAQAHSVTPMVYEATYACPSFRSCDPAIKAYYKKDVLRAVMLQTMKSMEFMDLYEKMRVAGFQPCVVKGIVCRSLYPNPDHRVSSDEDVFIPESQFEACHEYMLKEGMVLTIPNQKIYDDYEVPYGRPGSGLYIELHKHMFSPEEIAYGYFNEYFDGIHDRLIPIQVEGGTVYSMPHSEHLFFLICHALKHFLHGGFGLRQVCDILMYGKVYAGEIDWPDLYEKCGQIAARKFVASMFVIGDKYLGLETENYPLPDEWRAELGIDESMMLKDLLDAGIFGNSEAARKQSSNITVAALADQRQGKRAANGLMKMLFPPVVTLKGRYTYLENHHWLLPIAWISRIATYIMHKNKGIEQGSEAAQILRIGNERVELMREYGIIK